MGLRTGQRSIRDQVLSAYRSAGRSLGMRPKPTLATLPAEATAADRRIIVQASGYTMTSTDALWAALQATKHVVNNQIPGAIVECGVWRGGSMMVMLRMLNELGVRDREAWLYDTFGGMTPPSPADTMANSGASAADIMSKTPVGDGYNIWARASLEDVKRNIGLTEYPAEKVKYVVGDICKTLSEQVPDKIAILRLDTDWYESTKAEFEGLYHLLQVGGVCIVDDYGFWNGARKATDEFFGPSIERLLMHKVDDSARMWVKVQ